MELERKYSNYVDFLQISITCTKIALWRTMTTTHRRRPCTASSTFFLSYFAYFYAAFSSTELFKRQITKFRQKIVKTAKIWLRNTTESEKIPWKWRQFLSWKSKQN